MTPEEMDKLSLEDTFSRIEELMDEMGREDIPLEQSFGMYKEGMELLKHCDDVIDKVEKQIEILSAKDSKDDED